MAAPQWTDPSKCPIPQSAALTSSSSQTNGSRLRLPDGSGVADDHGLTPQEWQPPMATSAVMRAGLCAGRPRRLVGAVGRLGHHGRPEAGRRVLRLRRPRLHRGEDRRRPPPPGADGSFSRNGWDTPAQRCSTSSPAPYRILGSHSWALHVGALLVNGASIVGVAHPRWSSAPRSSNALTASMTRSSGASSAGWTTTSSEWISRGAWVAPSGSPPNPREARPCRAPFRLGVRLLWHDIEVASPAALRQVGA